MFTLIEYNKTEIAKNFKSYEFFYPDFQLDYRRTLKPFYLSNALITAPQIIRIFFNNIVNITSVHRLQENQYFHFYFMAVDLRINFGNSPFDHAQLLNNIRDMDESPLYLQLRKAGINGFGLSDSHLHIDTRQGIFNNHDSIGPVTIFEE
jgi:hypothetical protein